MDKTKLDNLATFLRGALLGAEITAHDSLPQPNIWNMPSGQRIEVVAGGWSVALDFPPEVQGVNQGGLLRHIRLTFGAKGVNV